MERVHSFDFNEEQLLFMTEVILFVHLGIEVRTKNFLVNLVTEVNLEVGLEEVLKKMLMGPLTDYHFRQRFCRHFENHPIIAVRLEGNEWLTKVLVSEQ